jgi:hypothetical protein
MLPTSSEDCAPLPPRTVISKIWAWRLAFARPGDREAPSAHGRGGRELSDLAETVTQRVRRVAERAHRQAIGEGDCSA